MHTLYYIVLGIVVLSGFIYFLAKFCGFNKIGHEP